MAMEQMLAFIQSLPPEQQQAAMQQMSQMSQQQQPGDMPPPGQMPPQGQDPRMGMPGQGGLTPQQKMDAGNPDAFRDYAGEGSIIGDQQAQAQALRDTATPQGIQTGSAGFVAANPLSHLASGIQKGMGAYQAGQALDEKKALSELTTKTQQDVASSVLEKQKAQAMAKELRENRRGTPMEEMAANQNRPGYA